MRFTRATHRACANCRGTWFAVAASMRRAIIAVMLLSSIAYADDLSHLSGRVLDENTGQPVEGAIVMISGPNGLESVVSTGIDGKYGLAVKPGAYNVIFVHGSSRSSGRVEVKDFALLDGKVDSTAGEVIVIREKIRPPVPPKALNHKPRDRKSVV